MAWQCNQKVLFTNKIYTFCCFSDCMPLNLICSLLQPETALNVLGVEKKSYRLLKFEADKRKGLAQCTQGSLFQSNLCAL